MGQCFLLTYGIKKHGHVRSTIDLATAKKVLRMRKKRFTAKEIAFELDISWHVVRNIIARKSWKNA